MNHPPTSTRPRCDDARVRGIIDWFESLTPTTLDQLPRFYIEQARFKDPFNAVEGVAAIRAIFEHMFRTLEQPRFAIQDVIVQGDQCFLTWDFDFRLKRRGAAMRIHGGSHLQLDPSGRILLHRDYWDAAEELYEKLPVLGVLMRWLRRRAG
jgi:ketosteroid isomerase-like protein